MRQKDDLAYAELLSFKNGKCTNSDVTTLKNRLCSNFKLSYFKIFYIIVSRNNLREVINMKKIIKYANDLNKCVYFVSPFDNFNRDKLNNLDISIINGNLLSLDDSKTGYLMNK
jgi:hypothetical protein